MTWLKGEDLCDDIYKQQTSLLSQYTGFVVGSAAKIEVYIFIHDALQRVFMSTTQDLEEEVIQTMVGYYELA